MSAVCSPPRHHQVNVAQLQGKHRSDPHEQYLDSVNAFNRTSTRSVLPVVRHSHLCTVIYGQIAVHVVCTGPLTLASECTAGVFPNFQHFRQNQSPLEKLTLVYGPIGFYCELFQQRLATVWDTAR